MLKKALMKETENITGTVSSEDIVLICLNKIDNFPSFLLHKTLISILLMVAKMPLAWKWKCTLLPNKSQVVQKKERLICSLQLGGLCITGTGTQASQPLPKGI